MSGCQKGFALNEADLSGMTGADEHYVSLSLSKDHDVVVLPDRPTAVKIRYDWILQLDACQAVVKLSVDPYNLETKRGHSTLADRGTRAGRRAVRCRKTRDLSCLIIGGARYTGLAAASWPHT